MIIIESFLMTMNENVRNILWQSLTAIYNDKGPLQTLKTLLFINFLKIVQKYYMHKYTCMI
jgi:hypothetical protein